MSYDLKTPLVCPMPILLPVASANSFHSVGTTSLEEPPKSNHNQIAFGLGRSCPSTPHMSLCRQHHAPAQPATLQRSSKTTRTRENTSKLALPLTDQARSSCTPPRSRASQIGAIERSEAVEQ